MVFCSECWWETLLRSTKNLEMSGWILNKSIFLNSYFTNFIRHKNFLLQQLTSFHAPSVIKSIRIRNEVLRPGFLSSIIEFTLANRYDKVKALASLVTSAGGYALWTKFCHHRLVGVSV